MTLVLRFWKPYGVLTRFTDEVGRPTLANYLTLPGVYPVGRLDADSEGLLLLTDDGMLAGRLTDPTFAHPRTYLAQVERIPDEAALQRLRAGLELRDKNSKKLYHTRPALADLLPEAPTLPERPVPIRHRQTVPTAWLRLTLTEGHKHQVRQMTAAVGYPTLRLVRWAVGAVTLAGLQPGEWQALSEAEIAALRRAVTKRV